MVKPSKAKNDDGGGGREDAEMMDVDHEEKMAVDEGTASSSSEEEEEEEIPTRSDKQRQTLGSSVPFLDTFYSLSPADPQERAQAARDLIQYCLIGPDSNIKDASYALKRLLNGVCSGRAAARQGNASALASFVKLANQQGKLKDIQNESRKEGEEEVSDLSFIRSRLIAATEPSESQGKLKGSEERDLKFGRLFGILAVVRSTTLLPLSENHADIDEIIEVTTAYVKDLAALYKYKKWMREPAAHAVGTLLNSYYSACSESTEAVKIVHHLVNNVVVPELLARGDNTGASEPFFASYSAEQIALALHIQSNVSVHSNGLSKPINQPILTKETMPYVAQALSETSSVTQPRTHLVWDTLCSFISEPVKDTTARNVEVRKMKETCPVGSESVHDLLEALMSHVVIENLMGIYQSNDTGTKDNGKTTHERSALALCLVRNLSGVEFVSSIYGRTRLILDPEIIENLVIKPAIVKTLFMKPITVGMGKGKKQSSHLLKPLALQVLESIVATFDNISDDNSDLINRRLAFAVPFLSNEPRFDSITKTNIIAQLLETEGNANEDHSELWGRYIGFLENQIASAVADEGESQSEEQVVPYKAVGHVDQLFKFAKMLLRRESNVENDNYSSETTRRILGYLMASGFFDCRSVTESKKKKEKKAHNVSHHPAVQSATLISSQRPEATLLPYNVRSAASARFYSLVADYILVSANRSAGNGDSEVLDFYSDVIQAWDDLEKAGVLSLGSQEVDDPSSDDKELEDPKSVVKELKELVERARQDSGTDTDQVRQARVKCTLGFSILASTLYVHLLGCGRPEELVEDDPDADDDNDAADVREFLTDLKNISAIYFESEDSNEGDDDRLSVLAELCVNILSSPLSAGNQSRGGSPTLLREAVRYAWVGGLALLAAQSDGKETESNFLDVLLESIGVEGGVAQEGDGDHSDEESDSDSDEESKSSEDVEDPSPFTSAAKLDDIEMRDQDDDNEDQQSEHSADVELDPERLQSFLEEDSDADINEGELEHHAGADKALAKLIQLKQEARKAGQMARERIEITQQIRCLLLLDILVVGRTEDYGWGSLLSSEKVLQMFIPILHYRGDLERSVSKAAEKGSSSIPGISQKKALLERLTLLLKGKIFKMKHTGHRRWGGSVDDVKGLCSDVASGIMTEMKRSHASREHQSCCSAALTAVLRAIPTSESAEEYDKIKLEVASTVYEDAVREWSTKRTIEEATMFEDFMNRCPAVAQATLVSPLTLAATGARSPFLKCESFRLLSFLYSRKADPSDERSDLDEKAVDHLASAIGPVLDAFKLSLQDPELKKAKWVRELLKSMRKLFTCVTFTEGWGKLSNSTQEDIMVLLVELKKSDSTVVRSACDKLLELMKDEANKPSRDERKPGEDEEQQDADNKKPPGGDISKKRKKKKKKKKSKKRKR